MNFGESRPLIWALSISLALVFSMMLSALAGPYLGLGSGDEFVFWKWFGISRGTLTRTAGAFCLVLLAWLAAASPGFRRIRLQLGPVLWKVIGQIAVNETGVLAVAGRWFGVTWRLLNRDWAATVLLIPFAVYVALFVLVVLPGTPWMAPDSTTYVAFATSRTIGYTVFLRLIALLSNDPRVLILVPLLIGIGATVFFIEALQRLVRNIAVTFGVGMLILFNWPLLEHGAYVLSDYTFFAALTITLGFAVLVIREPRTIFLLSMAVAAGITLSIRPIGVFLALVTPFLCLIWPHRWKTVTAWFVMPLAGMYLSVAAVHWAVYDYFALSAFSGYPLGANTAMVMKEDTPLPYPELRDRINQFAKPYQETYRTLHGSWKRYEFLVNNTNPLIQQTGQVVKKYMEENNLVRKNDVARTRAVAAFFNGLSPLNRILGEVPIMANETWVGFDAMLADIARRAHAHNPSDTLAMLFDKVPYAWRMAVIQFGPGKSFDHHQPFTPGAAYLGAGKVVTEHPRENIPLLNIDTFNQIANLVYGRERRHAYPFVILVSMFVALGVCVHGFAVRRRAPPIAGAIAFLGMTATVYYVLVSLAQVPIARFVIMIIPASAAVLMSPILALPWLARAGKRIRDALAARNVGA